MGDYGLKPPALFNFEGEQASQWSVWKKQFEWFLKATKKDKEDEIVQISVLITCLGPEGARVYDTFVFANQADREKIAPVLKQFDDHFKPKTSETFERFKFLSRKQSVEESFDAFLLDLKGLIASCNYDTQRDSILRDQIVIGISDHEVREQLLCESTLDLKKAVEICRARESSKKLAEQMQAASLNQMEVNAMSKKKQMEQGNNGRQRGSAPRGQNQCRYCGSQHERGKCPAYGKKCLKCGMLNHFSKVCEQSSEQLNGRPQDQKSSGSHHSSKQEQNCAVLSSSKSAPEFELSSIGQAMSEESSWFISLFVEGIPVSFKIDTGAQCNVMPISIYEQLSSRPLLVGSRVTAYNGQPLKVLGRQTLCIMHRAQRFNLVFEVVDEKGSPILGLPSCIKLNVVKRVSDSDPGASRNLSAINIQQSTITSLLQQYEAVFRGIGKLPQEHTIKLRPDAKPVVRPARRLPFKIRDAVKEKLDEMEELGLIAKVQEPTEWASPIAVVRKANGDIRICLDPVDLNKSIQRQNYQVPSAQEIFSRIGKARFYSTLDATSGFLQVPLDELSTFLTTMATPFGRYRSLRLPFGLSSSPEAYQQMMIDLFGDLDGVEVYFDDFFVWGETLEQHNARLAALLERCVKVNLRLNKEKCKFLVPEIKYIGHIIGHETLKPDPEKVAAIAGFKQPADKHDLQRFLGMVNYLAKFCSKLSEQVAPLRSLLKTEVAWQWDANQEKVFNDIKMAVSSLPILRLFNPAEHVTVSVDASSHGVGAVLLQKGQPVEFASRTLTETQRRYAQIEKELLAVQFGLQRFHQYVFGQTVTVESDHKPLIGILNKAVAECSPRIQRMRLLLQLYDFKLLYKPGRDLHIADALSRAPEPREYVEDTAQNSEENVSSVVCNVIQKLVSQEKFVKATAVDPTLTLVCDLVRRGWPEHKRNCPSAAKPFWQHRHDLVECGGLLLKGEQIVVPTVLIPDVLEQIHDGHLGISKCIERAKLTAYWPGYTDQIKNMVERCSTCQENRHQNPAQPSHPIPLPDYPFQKVAADLFEVNRLHYLLVVDYYSKWPCAVQLSSLTSEATIREIKRFFIDFGFPEQLVSDNGPQFDSAIFRKFCSDRGIQLTTASPVYPRSNGLAERTVQTVKESFIKSRSKGKSMWDILQVLRSTPVGNGLPSPSVLLQRRNLRGNLPFTKQALMSKQVSNDREKIRLQQRQSAQAFHAAGRKRFLPSLSPGISVRVRVGKKWIKGAIETVCQQPNSYIVKTQCGRVFRRNRQHINVDKTIIGRAAEKPSGSCSSTENSVVPRTSGFFRFWQSTGNANLIAHTQAPTVLLQQANSSSGEVERSQQTDEETRSRPTTPVQQNHADGFVGFTPPQTNHPGYRRPRGRPRRSQSVSGQQATKHSLKQHRSTSTGPVSTSARVTRSGRLYSLAQDQAKD